ncbi:Xaa-Pro dipeptidase [Salinispirillum sp. LH 10-3-1]|uniref:Xaa-Pro dipeptidase n=1 Tax=Salinispirillum sp. LH 10-3-1 TaxID=2952525 RepID=A0AB38YJ60_9GAMM
MQYYAEHLATLTKRYQTALAATGFDTLVLSSGSQTYYFEDDHAHPYHPYPFVQQWLPYRPAPDTFLVISATEKPRLIWPAKQDFWHITPTEPQGEWTRHWRIEGATQLKDWLPGLSSGHVAWIGAEHPALSDIDIAITVNPTGLKRALEYDRAYKTDYEINWMVEATERAVQGHRAAEQAFLAGESELDIYRAYLMASGQREIDEPYPGIVGLNESAAILHYENKQVRQAENNRTLLIDAGAQANGYASDITRTYTRDQGLFADLLADVNTLQLDITSKAIPGMAFPDLHTETLRGVADILQRHKLCSLSVDEQMAKRIPQVFFPHGLGHLLGLQVHDSGGHQIDATGTLQKPTAEAPFLRLTRTLDVGMVITIEPGLYFIPMLLKQMTDTIEQHGCNLALIEQLLPYGGIRIEDNVLVTQQGNRNFTREGFGA